jgi:hypothetical protein
MINIEPKADLRTVSTSTSLSWNKQQTFWNYSVTQQRLLCRYLDEVPHFLLLPHQRHQIAEATKTHPAFSDNPHSELSYTAARVVIRHRSQWLIAFIKRCCIECWGCDVDFWWWIVLWWLARRIFILFSVVQALYIQLSILCCGVQQFCFSPFGIAKVLMLLNGTKFSCRIFTPDSHTRQIIQDTLKCSKYVTFTAINFTYLE